MLETYDPQDYYEAYPASDDYEIYEPRPRRLDVLGLTAFGLIFFIVFTILRDGLDLQVRVTAVEAASPPATASPPLEPALAPATFTPEQMSLLTAPYADYWVTQGLHGYEYGHAAVDLAAGEGEPVLSPINGFVADRFTDQYGNPTLVLENDYYQVTLLHGEYSVQIGQTVTAGEQVGVESNQGYTTDMQGRSCAGRNCGFHTHLNVFNKLVGENVDPLDLIEP